MQKTPFEQALGDRFHRLGPQVRQLHGGRVRDWQGQVSVERGGGPIGALAARLGGFPGPMDRAPFRLRVDRRKDGTERWIRSFDGHRTESDLWIDDSGQMRERFGIVTCAMEPFEKRDALHMRVTTGWLWDRLRLPAWAIPRSSVSVWQDEAGRYRFDIRAYLPVVGRILRYEGWLRAAS